MVSCIICDPKLYHICLVEQLTFYCNHKMFKICLLPVLPHSLYWLSVSASTQDIVMDAKSKLGNCRGSMYDQQTDNFGFDYAFVRISSNCTIITNGEFAKRLGNHVPTAGAGHSHSASSHTPDIVTLFMLPKPRSVQIPIYYAYRHSASSHTPDIVTLFMLPKPRSVQIPIYYAYRHSASSHTPDIVTLFMLPKPRSVQIPIYYAYRHSAFCHAPLFVTLRFLSRSGFGQYFAFPKQHNTFS